MSGTGINPGSSATRDSMGGPANYYETSLEPMQMLHAMRAGQPFVNHIYRPSQQILPPNVPSAPVTQYQPMAPIAEAPAAPVTGWQPGNFTLGTDSTDPGPGASAGGK
jgi:hypothetical protein